MEKIVYCETCRHRPILKENGVIIAPEHNGVLDLLCPYVYGNSRPTGDFFCKNGEENSPKVGIYDFKMPKACIECPTYCDDGDYPTCILAQHSAGYTFNARANRMSCCPLRELKGN